MAQSLVEQSGDTLEIKAGKNVLRSCLKELEDRLTGNYKPELARFFYVDFLRADDLLLDENYLPDFRHWKHIDDDAAYLKELLASATGNPPTFQQRLERFSKRLAITIRQQNLSMTISRPAVKSLTSNKRLSAH